MFFIFKNIFDKFLIEDKFWTFIQDIFSLVLKNNYQKNDYNRKLFLKTLFKKTIFKNCFKNHYRSHSNWLPNHLFLSNEMGKSGEMMSILLFQNTKKKKKKKKTNKSKGATSQQTICPCLVPYNLNMPTLLSPVSPPSNG